MSTTTEKLIAIAEAYEQKAAGLRLAAAELNGHRVAKKQARGNIAATVAAAAALRAEATGTNGATSREARREAVRRQKLRASWTPTRRAAQAARVRAAQGKLQRARHRTLGPPKVPRAVAAQRAKTATFLAKIAAHDGPFIGTKKERVRFGVLVHTGYLQKEGDGVVRTDKPFTA